MSSDAWHVERSAFQPYFESGVSHGRDQWISMVATTWSAMGSVANGKSRTWSSMRVVVKGDDFEHWINAVMVLDGLLHSDEARAGTARRWATSPTIRGVLSNAKPDGPLSLQHHGATVWFKNLKIRRL